MKCLKPKTDFAIVKPNLISFTGVDSATNISDLSLIYKKYPNVEFGVCFNETIYSLRNSKIFSVLEKVKLYPYLPWVAHLSEGLVDHIFNHKKIDFLKSAPWKRVQFNIDWHKNPCVKMVLSKVIDMTIEINPMVRPIISENIICRSALLHAELPDFIDILSDVSGGKGISPTKNNAWPVPYHSRFGFAGGIKPSNVLKVIEEISFIKKEKNIFYWIDMESSLKCKKTKKFMVNKILEILTKIDKMKQLIANK